MLILLALSYLNSYAAYTDYPFCMNVIWLHLHIVFVVCVFQLEQSCPGLVITVTVDGKEAWSEGEPKAIIILLIQMKADISYWGICVSVFMCMYVLVCVYVCKYMSVCMFVCVCADVLMPSARTKMGYEAIWVIGPYA